MPYTSTQQAQISAAKASLDSANTALQNAISSYNSAYQTFCNGWWSSLANCDIVGAQSNVPKWVKFGLAPTPLLPVTAIPTILSSLGLVKNWQRTPYTKPTSCKDALEKGPLVSWKCRRGKGDCIKESTCDGRISQYNLYINAVYSANASVSSATQTYEQAKSNYDNVLNAVAQEVKNDPDFIHAQTELALEADIAKKAQLQKWFVFAVIAVLIIITAVVIYKSRVAH